MYYFTADLHLNHRNIIPYCNRPFKDVDEMNKRLVANWNERVQSNDTVIHIGDFCWRSPHEWLQQFNGTIIFLRGNHDRKNGLNTRITKLYLNIGGIDICCVHRPEDADLSLSLNFVGHIHEKWKHKNVGSSLLINVGVDVWDFRPITFDEIQRYIGGIK